MLQQAGSTIYNKISKVVDATLAAECLSLKEGLHEAVYVWQVIEEIFGIKDKSIEVHGIVDKLNWR